MSYTKNNHFRYYWTHKGTKEIWGMPKSPDDVFSIQFGLIERTPASFRQECINSAVNIAQKATKPIGVFFSGGIDSEIICRSFLSEGIKPTCLIIVFNDNLNDHDIVYARKFCKENKLEFIEIEINIFDYFKSLEFFFQKYPVLFSHRPLIISAIKKCSGFHYVMGDGDIFLKKEKIGGVDLCLVKEPSFTPIFDFMNFNKIEGTPRFFSYSPELICSFLNEKSVVNFRKVVKNSNYVLNNIEDFKAYLFHEIWSEISCRPKFHGYEKVRDQFEYWRKTARKNNLSWHKRVIIPFSELYRSLTKEKICFSSNRAF